MRSNDVRIRVPHLAGRTPWRSVNEQAIVRALAHHSDGRRMARTARGVLAHAMLLLLLLFPSLPSQAADLAKARSLLMHGRYEEAAEIYKPEAAASPQAALGLGRLPGVARQDRRGGRGPQAAGRQAGGDPGPIGPAGLRARRFGRSPPPCRCDPATGLRASLGPLHPGRTGPHLRPLGRGRGRLSPLDRVLQQP